MPQIRPVSDLRNNFAEISRIVHNSNEPIYLTKNGYGDMVVMSVEQFDALTLDSKINTALRASDAEVMQNPNCGIPFSEFASELRQKLVDKVGKDNA